MVGVVAWVRPDGVVHVTVSGAGWAVFHPGACLVLWCRRHPLPRIHEVVRGGCTYIIMRQLVKWTNPKARGRTSKSRSRVAVRAGLVRSVTSTLSVHFPGGMSTAMLTLAEHGRRVPPVEL